MQKGLLSPTASGLYCSCGDFYVDPWLPVSRAIITHAHSDHARAGMGTYLTAASGESILRARMGDQVRIQAARYGETFRIGDAILSLHPAGHVLGSSQVRIESRGQVWVISGDYKTAEDCTCTPFEPVSCHGFVTEATFALPVYRWKDQAEIFGEINSWWRSNRDQGKASLLYAYALGKAQRVLAGIDSTIGPILTHGAVERVTQIYRNQNVSLPPTMYARGISQEDVRGALILAPPSARGTTWARRFGNASSALASGWMQIRGTRRRKSVDRGFALSDHADWPGLLSTIRATRAETIWLTHGHSEPLARMLDDEGLQTRIVQTEFEGELDDQLGPDEAAEPSDS